MILRTLSPRGQWGWLVAFAAATALIFPETANAHDIPASVMLRIFVKPEGRTLRVIVRAPLEAMRDINFPLRDGGRYLDIAKSEPLLRDATTTWITNAIQLYENDSLLTTSRIVATRISLPSDQSFAEYTTAVARLQSPTLGSSIDLPWQQAVLDVEIDYPIQSARNRFSIDPALARLGVRTTTVLRFLPADGRERALAYAGDPGLVRLDPHWYQAAGSFIEMGFNHIWSGIDHLLFIFCLVIPFRKLKPLIVVITAFTVAHSITLIASAFGVAPGGLWFPPLIEVLIAASILYMALENIVMFATRDSETGGADSGLDARLERRWMMAFAFGLVHGFGFSFALRDSLQFAGSHLVTSLLSFNIGVEIGQLTVLCLAVPMLHLLFQRVVSEKIGAIILSGFVAHTAWHWLSDRWVVFRRYRVDISADRTTLVQVIIALLMVGTLVAIPKLKTPVVPDVER